MESRATTCPRPGGPTSRGVALAPLIDHAVPRLSTNATPSLDPRAPENVGPASRARPSILRPRREPVDARRAAVEPQAEMLDARAKTVDPRADLLDAHGAALDAQGVVIDAHGAVIDAHGAVIEGNGSGSERNGLVIERNGSGSDGNGAGSEHRGPSSEGNAPGRDGDAKGNEGMGGTPLLRGEQVVPSPPRDAEPPRTMGVPPMAPRRGQRAKLDPSIGTATTRQTTIAQQTWAGRPCYEASVSSPLPCATPNRFVPWASRPWPRAAGIERSSVHLKERIATRAATPPIATPPLSPALVIGPWSLVFPRQRSLLSTGPPSGPRVKLPSEAATIAAKVNSTASMGRKRLTPRTFIDTEGTPFPTTVLDDRSGVESGRRGFYELAAEEARVKRLPPDTFQAIRAHAAAGERALSAGDLPGAWREFVSALQQLPDPVEQWNAAGWLLVAMGETQFRGARYEKAAGPFQDAIVCPGTLGNPWLHLRLGQVRLELGETDRAADELARAYMGGGREVFEGEDPKYFALVEKVLQPPAGMDRLP